MPKPRIATIGDVNVDLITRIDKMPALGKQVVTDNFEVHGGGCSANFALSCARLGMDIRLFGKVGDDVFGSYVLIELEDNKVNTKNVKLTNNKTGVTVAIVEGIERSFISFRGENSTFNINDIDISKIEADIVHLPSYYLLESLRPDYSSLIDVLHRAGIKVSFDTGWDPMGFIKETTEPLFDILPKTDIFVPNIDEARKILGVKETMKPEKVADILLGMGIKVAAIKMGRNGSLIASKDMMEMVPAFDVKVVDTTGAGDNFNAGFISAYISGKDLRMCAIIGSATAALKVGGVGWSTYATRDQVNAFLKERGYEGL
ncbi:carbohydrate kinase family protein [Methanocella sp. CWC-04]|uniref:Carbohydrate kinase family protein n=1 Tax=Methanooceanicella nereidis TaxID=2052831 RepID=A0AAP2W6C5_9EURY|nr:carbohydrate kinase family protein [Methanocella sp. CWC-04]